MEIVYVIIIALLVGTFLLYFRLCRDVKKIRQVFNPGLPDCYSKELAPKFNFFISVGDIEKAKEVLYVDIMTSPHFAKAFKENYSEESRDKLVELYQPYFEQLGIEMDFSKIKSIE